MRLEWSPLARRDLREAIDYIAEDNPRAADDIEDKIFAAARRLIEHPNKGAFGAASWNSRMDGAQDALPSHLPPNRHHA